MTQGDGIERYLPRLSEGGTRWVRFAAVILAAAALFWAAMKLRPVLTPIAAALAIAYVLNPAVTWLETRGRISRLATVSVGLAFVIGLALLLILLGAVQVFELAERLPGYAAAAQQWAVRTFPRLFKDVDHQKLADLLHSHGMSAGRALVACVSGAFSNLMYWLSVLVLLPMYTFFFLLHFNRIVQTLRDHLPAAYRPTIVRVVSTIDRAVSDFFRGRLIVCLIVGTLSAIGWYVVSVPYAFPLGALAGTLNLVPYASGLALVPALSLTYLRAVETGDNWVWALAAVFAIYAIVQALESFVLSPVIESRSSGLHPLTTVVALLIGAQVAGLLGMLLSIPLASTLKSLGGEYLMPEIRRLAQRDPHPPDIRPPQTATTDEPAPRDQAEVRP